MHKKPAMDILALWIAMAMGLAAGCGPRPPPDPAGEDPSRRLIDESLRRQEAAEKDHLIGNDHRGFPVYGVDDEGQPVYTRD